MHATQVPFRVVVRLMSGRQCSWIFCVMSVSKERQRHDRNPLPNRREAMHATQVPFRVVVRLNHLLPNIRANQQSTSEYSCNHDDLLPNEFKSGTPHNTQII